MTTKIPMESRAKRPAFFADSAIDQVVTMMMELMAELWVVKERVHTLEKVLSTHGLEVAEEIESCQFSADEKVRLEGERQQFVSTILRSFEADFVSRADLNTERDELTDKMKSGDT